MADIRGYVCDICGKTIMVKDWYQGANRTRFTSEGGGIQYRFPNNINPTTCADVCQECGAEIREAIFSTIAQLKPVEVAS